MLDALYQVTAPHFCCGIVVAHDGAITAAAPILQWAYNKPFGWFRRYAQARSWRIERVKIID